jgi:hypothetical protein
MDSSSLRRLDDDVLRLKLEAGEVSEVADPDALPGASASKDGSIPVRSGVSVVVGSNECR